MKSKTSSTKTKTVTQCGYAYSDVASHPLVLLLPYSVHSFGLVNAYSMGIPIVAPSLRLPTVDVRLSSDNTGQQDCSTLSQQLGDAVLPDGEFRLTHTFERTSLTRGDDRLDLGTTYLGRPSPSELGASDDALVAWTRSASRPSHDHGANATYATARAAASGSADASMTSAALSGFSLRRLMDGLGAPGAALTRARVASPRRRATTLSVFNDAARSGSTCSCGSGATFGGVCAILRLPVGC